MKAVLESVFPLSELKAFVSQQKIEKEVLMARWSQLSTGIRLFNKFLGKGGDNIEDIYSQCNKEIEGIKDGINKLLNKSSSIIKVLQGKYEKYET